MDNQTPTPQPSTGNGGGKDNVAIYYVIGAVVLVAVLGVGYMMRPKPAEQKSEALGATTQPLGSGQQQQQQASGPIKGLACERQYYNPVVGFPKYFLSVEGVNVKPATNVSCEFTVTVAGRTVATEAVTAPLVDVVERNGTAFRCTTKELELERNVPTKVDVVVRDDQNVTTSCTRTFIFP